MIEKLLLTIVILRTAWQIFLEVLNLLYSTNPKSRIPDMLKDRFTPEVIEKSRSYLKDRTRLKVVSQIVQMFATIYLVLHGLPLLERLFMVYSPLLQAFLFFGALGLILYAVNLPFRLYSIFVIESNYGFNTATKRTFLRDQILTVSLIVAFSMVLIPLLLWLLSHPVWWWQASILVFGFILFFWFIQPLLIAPLFYKFTELEDEELKKKIREFIKKASVKILKIYKVNASKRTKKQNAYVTGIGRSRRLVLYDTLMDYPQDELLAVVGHELGHHVKKHIQKDVLLFSIYAMFQLYLTNFLYRQILKSGAFNVQRPHTIFVYSLLFVSAIAYLLQPLVNYFSRRMEYEADEFSAKLTNTPTSMISALKRLVKANLSNPDPHPLYKVWYYSHPAPGERIKALSRSIRSES
ncbi:MAG: Zn-dependent protease with chaperone function [Thermotoga sp. 50_1627]|nr:MAG: Zn-dependent protease with chaperone function [Thermotoga sp. 50_64]KUK24030.1 MAG: Zn-dependent protease with chaperone function [Thermotoga sp. 50_1627]HBT39079.1 peptidase [Pseudothermotoga sp.]HCO98356.1 peptidase [Pseudothermotoga sp.]